MTYTVVDVDATTRNGRAAVREIVREIADDHAYDPYGSGMLALGALVDTLWESGEGVPSDIATPGAGGGAADLDDPAVQMVLNTVGSGAATTDDVRYFMFVLSRYIDVARLAGHTG